jgi:FMN-dependent NADH-azoreductase
MSHLLYIKASPRSDRSYAISVADTFIDAYERSHPDDQVTSLDVFYDDLPNFDFEAVAAKYKIMHGKPHDEKDKAVWDRIVETISDFKAADKYVMAVPMWNFSIPYRLKQYLDILLQPGLTFAAKPDGSYEGLVTGKPVLLVCAQGGSYPPGSPAEAWDFQKRYLELIFGFMGFQNIQSIVVDSTMGGPESAARSKARAIDRAHLLAKNF